MKPAHVYTNEGEYTVSLTVSDSAGNKNTAAIKVVVLNDNEYCYKEFKVLDLSTNLPLSGVSVYCESIGNKGVNLFKTDSNGIVRILIPTGNQTFYFYCEGFMPISKAVFVSKVNQREIVLLDKGEVIVGKIDVERLTIDEIKNLGIDTKDPENQHVFHYDMEVVFNNETKRVEFNTNSSGEIINVQENFVVINFTDPTKPAGPTENPPVGTAYIIAITNPDTTSPPTATALTV